MSEWDRIKAVFVLASAASGAERAALLDRECGDDPEVRREVESLLDAPGGLRTGDGARAAATITTPAIGTPLREGPGTRIGPYKLLQQIGEGGFGVVFLAEQETPVQRRVALKIIKLGMDTRQVVARFEQERQALAMMDHPNIARVLDAGATDTGRPYFVMELVRGDPITQYCDTHNLSVEERLGLFREVCHAVQHAHQKGIIHRDLKPSNVLVTVADGKPIPKVIDFGIAKATSARLTEKTLFTEHRTLIGTPEYMSPEQAEMTGVDIDTRSDIYSLGVLLYELLTGALPFDAARLRSAAFGEIQRIIREEDPPNPSTRLLTLQTIANVAAHRHTEPARLARLVRGDLDWIVMKALEKDRTRRYETANGLAADVERHLAGEPVLAAPPSAAYRVRKFVRRHRVGVGAGVAIAGALVLGIVGTTLGLAQAERQRGAAETARASEETQRKAAQASAAKAQKVTEYIQGMLGAADPHAFPRSPDYTVRQMLEEVAGGLVARLKGEPEIQSAIHVTMANAYRSLGRLGEAGEHADKAVALARMAPDAAAEADALDARAHVLHDRADYVGSEMSLREALAIRCQRFGEESAETAESLSSICDVLRHLARYAESETMGRRALGIQRRVLGGDDLSMAATLLNLSSVRHELGDGAGAEQLAREALALQRRLLGEEHLSVATAMSDLATVLIDKGDFASAEQLARDALATERRLLGDEHPDVALGMHQLAMVLQSKGDLAGAESMLRAALAMERRILGDEHPSVAACMSDLALLLMLREDYTGAEPLFRQALAVQRRALGDGHPEVAGTMSLLGGLLGETGDFERAEPLLREALTLTRRALGDEHPNVAASTQDLAKLLKAKGDYAGAEPLYREALAMMRRVMGDRNARVATISNNLAELLLERNDAAGAEALHRETLALRRSLFAGDHPDVADSLFLLGALCETLGRSAEAEPLLRESLAMRRRLFPSDHPRVASSLKRLGNCLYTLGRPAEAETVQQEALSMFQRLHSADHVDIAGTLSELGNTRRQVGQAAQAESLQREALEMYRRLHRGDHADATAAARMNLGLTLLASGRAAEAEALLREALETYRRVPGDRPELATALHNLASARLLLGSLDEAESLFKESLAMRDRLGERAHPFTALTLNGLAVCLQRLGRPAEAADQRREALAASRRLMPSGSPALSGALASFGHALVITGTPEAVAEAEPLLRECLEIRRAAFPDGHPEAWRRFMAMSLLGGAILGVAQNGALSPEVRIAKLREAEILALDGYRGLKDDPGVPTPAQVWGDDWKRQALERIVKLYETWEVLAPGTGFQQKAAEWRKKLENGP